MHLQILGYLAWFLVAGSAIGCLYLLYACNAVAKFAQSAMPRAVTQPPVTIMKPLRGEDPALAENLRSFLRQDYPAFQLVCGVADAGDPAAVVVRQLIDEFPQADIALVVDALQRGTNLKVANLRNMLPAAKHDLLVLADSDMRVGPDYLAAVTAPLVEGGRPVSSRASIAPPPRVGFGPISPASTSITASCRRRWSVKRWGRAAGCFGATMAFGRATLAAVGGFEALARHARRRPCARPGGPQARQAGDAVALCRRRHRCRGQLSRSLSGMSCAGRARFAWSPRRALPARS